MYLAKLKNGSKISYQIRQSYQAENRSEEQSYDYRIVYELGTNPNLLIKIFEDHIILFDDNLIEAVSACSTGEVETILEQLLWDFLPKETKRRLSIFQSRSKQRFGPLTENDQEAIARQVHIFDRRRLYYLRYGAVDQSRLSRLHEKCCRPLLGQSRDEREYYLTVEEKALQPGNYLQYVYAIFNLQKYFSESFAPWLPESLAVDEMAEHFLKELCWLNRDPRFWQEEKPTDSLHAHLIRYLIMFFDYTPSTRSFFDDFARQFMGDHRKFRWPERKSSHSPEKISQIFMVSNEELNGMTREQLNRLYRQKAMQLHPDLGGDHDLFIELTEIYNELLRSK
ncbi:MAG: hypothetical protein WBB23_21995 [Desulforhopalus sp.]